MEKTRVRFVDGLLVLGLVVHWCGCIRVVAPAAPGDAGVAPIVVTRVSAVPDRQRQLDPEERDARLGAFGNDRLVLEGTGWDSNDVVVLAGGRQLDLAAVYDGGLAAVVPHDTPQGDIVVRSRGQSTVAPVDFHPLGPGHVEDLSFAGTILPPLKVVAAGTGRAPCPTAAEFPDGGVRLEADGTTACDADDAAATTQEQGLAGLAVAYTLSAQSTDAQNIYVSLMTTRYGAVTSVSYVGRLQGVVSQQALGVTPAGRGNAGAFVLHRPTAGEPVSGLLMSSRGEADLPMLVGSGLRGPAFFLSTRDGEGFALAADETCNNNTCRWTVLLAREDALVADLESPPMDGSLKALGLADAAMSTAAISTSHVLVGLACAQGTGGPDLLIHRLPVDLAGQTLGAVQTQRRNYPDGCGDQNCAPLRDLCAGEGTHVLEPLARGLWVRNQSTSDGSGILDEAAGVMRTILPLSPLASRTVVHQADGLRNIMGVPLGGATGPEQRRAEVALWRPGQALDVTPTRTAYARLAADRTQDVVYAFPEHNGAYVDVLDHGARLLATRSLLGAPLDVFPLPPEDGRLVMLLPNLAVVTDITGRVLCAAPVPLKDAQIQANPWRTAPQLAWLLDASGALVSLNIDPDESCQRLGEQRNNITLPTTGTHKVVAVSPHVVVLATSNPAGAPGDPGCRTWFTSVNLTVDVPAVATVAGSCNHTAVSFDSVREVLFATAEDAPPGPATTIIPLVGEPTITAPTLPRVRPGPGSIVMLPNGGGIGIFYGRSTNRLELGLFGAGFRYVTLDDDPSFPQGLLAASPDGRRLYVAVEGALTEFLVEGLDTDTPSLRPGSRVAITGHPTRLRVDVTGRRMAYTDKISESFGLVE
jgi:hypothetical protein